MESSACLAVPWYSVADAAEMLSMSVAWIYDKINAVKRAVGSVARHNGRYRQELGEIEARGGAGCREVLTGLVGAGWVAGA